jgi:predicted metalloendopeptidase
VTPGEGQEDTRARAAIWRDYSALKIDPADLVGNIRRANAFRWAYAVAKLDKPHCATG